MHSGTGDPVWRSDSPASRVALIAALELEARILRDVLGERSARILISGPGPERAGRAARQAVETGAEALIAWGLAGGLAGDTSSGTVVLPSRLISAAGEWRADAVWRERLSRVVGSRFDLNEAPLYSADRVLTTPEAKAALAACTGACAVDMESAAVARDAAEAGLPCVALRVVADGARDALPEGVETLVSADGSVRFATLAPFVASPRRFWRLLRLARRSRHARTVLRQVAEVLAEPAP